MAPDPADHQFVEQAAGNLNVAVGGEVGAPVVVLLHGLSAAWSTWKPLLPELVGRYRVVAVDLPGFGRSEVLPNGLWTLDRVAGEIAHALDELGVGRHALIGHSLGGGVGVTYGALYPARVQGLGLMAPGGFLRYPGYVKLAWRSEMAHRLGRRGTRLAEPAFWMSSRVRHRVFARFIHDPSQISARDLVLLARGSMQGRATAPAGVAIVAAYLWDQFERLTMPSLVLWGENDRIVPPLHAEELASLLPECRGLLRYENAGHMLMWDQPLAIGAALQQFLSTVVRDDAGAVDLGA